MKSQDLESREWILKPWRWDLDLKKNLEKKSPLWVSKSKYRDFKRKMLVKLLKLKRPEFVRVKIIDLR